jgi:uncharacterized protein YndB with AHSA1/START domain
MPRSKKSKPADIAGPAAPASTETPSGPPRVGAGEDVVITRTLEAPRDVVFKAWTDPGELSQWFGPRGFSVPSPEFDPRPKGAVRLDMRGPDGTQYPNRGTVREIEEPERFAFETSLPDDKGSPILHVLNTVTFSEDHGRTTLTLKAHVLDCTPAGAKFVEAMHAGWSQTLDRLGEHVTQPSARARVE